MQWSGGIKWQNNIPDCYLGFDECKGVHVILSISLLLTFILNHHQGALCYTL